jgi:hypothetical protein
MPECNHEEADTRIVVHVLHAIQVEQAKSVLVRTVDTDVVVILVGTFYNLKSIVPDLDLWVAFGMGRNFSYININTICVSLGEARSRSLPVFHALTGCDTTSSFYGKGKSFWQRTLTISQRQTLPISRELNGMLSSCLTSRAHWIP